MPNGRPYSDVLRSLTNQTPNDLVAARMEELRVPARLFAASILDLVPEGREKSLAVTKLEESVMWAIKSMALNQDKVT